MTTKTKRMYCEIAKAEEQPDGTLIVSGIASTGAVDSDGETVTPDAMKAALPDYMKFGAVREMHQPSAAGTALKAEVDDEGRTQFQALVVDPVAVKKVQTGVYKGFSIGGKVTERDPTDKKVIKGLKLVEVSLVDRPANPEAVISVFKAERSDEDDVTELAEMLDAGSVTPARVLELIKAASEPDGGRRVKEPIEGELTPVTKAADDVKKGLWSVSDFASLLGSVAWICRDAQSEADYEGDSSPVPAGLRAWLAQGLQLMQQMAAEEAAELLAELKAAAGEVDVIAMAAKGGELAKAGAKYSAATKQALADIHAGLKACCEKMDGLGYTAADDTEPDDDVSLAAKAELTKAQKAHDEALQAIAKAAGAKEGEVVAEVVAKVFAERDTLAKRVKELEAMPQPGKALLKVLGKAEDISPDDAKKVEPVRNSQGEVDDAATLIKAAHRSGGRFINPIHQP